MKTLTLIALTGLLLGSASHVLAQEEAKPAATPAPAAQAADRWQDKKVDIDVKDASAADVLKSVLERVGFGDTKIPESAAKREGKYSLTMTGVRAEDALRTACYIAGLRFASVTRDGRTQIALSPGSSESPFFVALGGQNGQNGWADKNKVDTIVRGAMSAYRAGRSTYPARIAVAGTRPRLTDKRVSLDVRKHSLRDLFKDVLKQADIDFVLEDGVPDDVKKSFTFENAPIETALDAICRSADLSWRVETKDGKPVVHIGKGVTLFRSRGVSELPDANAFENLAELEAFRHFEAADALERYRDATGRNAFRRFEELPALIDSNLTPAARKEIEAARRESRKRLEKVRKDLEREKSKEKEIERSNEPEKTPQPLEV